MQELDASGTAVAVGVEKLEPLVTRYRVDQRLLHWTHTAAFLGLVGTGIFLLPFRRLPFGLDFRGWIGGYSNVIISWHNWIAIIFLCLPAAILLVSWFASRDGPKDEGARTAGWGEIFPTLSQASGLNLAKKVHVWVTILVASAFTLTGSLMWARSYLSFGIVEWSYYLHDILTYLSLLLILGHLVVLHLLGAPEAMRGMVLGKVSKEWAESVDSGPLEDKLKERDK